MAKIVITEFMDGDAVDYLAEQFEVRYEPFLVDKRNELLDTLAGVDALIVRNRTVVDAELLDHAPALRVVGRLGVGLDNIDVGQCQARGIEVIPAIGANALAVAEYVITMTMCLLRGTYLSSTELAEGRWPRLQLSSGRETAGKTLGLIGFGGIGQKTALLAQAVGMTVIAFDPMIQESNPVWMDLGVERCDLDDLLNRADAISLHLPLTETTRGLLSRDRLEQMKRGAVVVNTARGGILDERAVADALITGRLAGAALDVFDQEPLPGNSGFVGVPNLILTPHIAGVTLESNERVSLMIAERVSQRLSTEVERRAP